MAHQALGQPSVQSACRRILHDAGNGHSELRLPPGSSVSSAPCDGPGDQREGLAPGRAAGISRSKYVSDFGLRLLVGWNDVGWVEELRGAEWGLPGHGNGRESARRRE